MTKILERIEVRETNHGPASALRKGPIVVNYRSKQVRDGGSERKRRTGGFLNLRLVQSLSQREQLIKRKSVGA